MIHWPSVWSGFWRALVMGAVLWAYGVPTEVGCPSGDFRGSPAWLLDRMIP